MHHGQACLADVPQWLCLWCRAVKSCAGLRYFAPCYDGCFNVPANQEGCETQKTEGMPDRARIAVLNNPHHLCSGITFSSKKSVCFGKSLTNPDSACNSQRQSFPICFLSSVVYRSFQQLSESVLKSEFCRFLAAIQWPGGTVWLVFSEISALSAWPLFLFFDCRMWEHNEALGWWHGLNQHHVRLCSCTPQPAPPHT